MTCFLNHQKKPVSVTALFSIFIFQLKITFLGPMTKVHHGKALYLVRWKGYGEEDDSWEPLEHLTSCRELVEAFEKCERDRSLCEPSVLGCGTLNVMPLDIYSSIVFDMLTRHGVY